MNILDILDLDSATLESLATLLNVPRDVDYRWTELDASTYTDTEPATTSTVTFSDTAALGAGRPVRVKQSGSWLYGRIVSITTDTEVEIAGEALSTGVAIDAIEIGQPELLVAMPLPLVDGTYGTGVTTSAIADLTPARVRWPLPAARIVDFEVIHTVQDSTTQPSVNIMNSGSPVSTAASGDGISVSDTWQNNGVDIDTAENQVDTGAAIDVSVTVAAGTGDAENLNVILYAVLVG